MFGSDEKADADTVHRAREFVDPDRSGMAHVSGRRNDTSDEDAGAGQ